MSVSDFVRRALTFIRDNPGCYAWQVGQHLWPGHPMNGRPAGDRGGGNLGAVVAGGHMGKLHKAGLVSGYTGTYQLTQAGLDALEEPSDD